MEICHRHVKSSHEAYLNSKRIVGLVLFCPVLLLKSFRTISCPYITQFSSSTPSKALMAHPN